MKNQKIFILVGMPGSGKTLATEIIKKKFNAHIIHTGSLIKEEVKRRGWKYTPENDKKMRLWFNLGREDLLAKRTWDKVKKKKGLIVIECPRAIGHLDGINKRAGYEIPVIYLYCPFKVRARRMQKRHRFKHETIKYLRDRDRSELRVGMGKVIKRAKYRISNQGNKKQLEKNIIKLFKKITA